MESKIPKPSGLKRPATVFKPIIPQERIKAASSVLSTKSTNFNELFLTAPRRLVHRARSPEFRVPQTRIKMRRSRSVSDLAFLKKNMDDVVPAKMPRLNEVVSKVAVARVGGTQTIQPATAAVKPTASKLRANPSVRSVPSRTLAGIGVKKDNSNTGGPLKGTSAATTGAAKTINKRIPPYDFKARYHDLLEKFKTLKEKYDRNCEALENFENLPEQLEKNQTALLAANEELASITTKNDSLRQQLHSAESKLESVTNSLARTNQELDELQTKHKILCEEHGEIRLEHSQLKTTVLQLTTENSYFKEELSACKENLFRSNVERKELHNALMDLRGNIRVFCRVRPPLQCEMDKPLCGWNYIDEATVEIINQDFLSKNKLGAAHIFNFDYVFHPGSRQEDVFESVSPLIQSAMDGYNICIFAYGQTGSGKTYTMDGIETNVGVIPRTVELLFQAVQNYKRLGWQYEIRATFLEIYNEVLYDLLSNEPKDMEIRMATTNKNDIYVTNITEETVATPQRLHELMEIAKLNRATASTVNNDRSSRSHAVTRIELIGYHEEKKEYSVGTINLVDLAGSESPKTSIRMQETKSINRSLSELGNVILALQQKNDHIPYRNSKLTHLLMPSLGGNSKTLMFINVAPFVDCFVESIKSLRFAATVNSCKVAKAKRNRYFNNNGNTSGS